MVTIIVILFPMKFVDGLFYHIYQLHANRASDPLPTSSLFNERLCVLFSSHSKLDYVFRLMHYAGFYYYYYMTSFYRALLSHIM